MMKIVAWPEMKRAEPAPQRSNRSHRSQISGRCALWLSRACRRSGRACRGRHGPAWRPPQDPGRWRAARRLRRAARSRPSARGRALARGLALGQLRASRARRQSGSSPVRLGLTRAWRPTGFAARGLGARRGWRALARGGPGEARAWRRTRAATHGSRAAWAWGHTPGCSLGQGRPRAGSSTAGGVRPAPVGQGSEGPLAQLRLARRVRARGPRMGEAHPDRAQAAVGRCRS